MELKRSHPLSICGVYIFWLSISLKGSKPCQEHMIIFREQSNIPVLYLSFTWSKLRYSTNSIITFWRLRQ